VKITLGNDEAILSSSNKDDSLSKKENIFFIELLENIFVNKTLPK
jgi:hypothetical protein